MKKAFLLLLLVLAGCATGVTPMPLTDSCEVPSNPLCAIGGDAGSSAE